VFHGEFHAIAALARACHPVFIIPSDGLD